jgi:hypothetical protein
LIIAFSQSYSELKHTHFGESVHFFFLSINDLVGRKKNSSEPSREAAANAVRWQS